jgi:DNA-binding CsgD family transcriptional regulator
MAPLGPPPGRTCKVDREKQALRLVGRIYEAALEPSGWHDFASELAEAYGGAAVAFGLQLPGFPMASAVFAVGFREPYQGRFTEYLSKGLPWQGIETQGWVGRFGLASEVLPDDALAATEIYQRWMKPQGLAACGPMGHTVALDGGRPVAGLALFRREGQPHWTPDDLTLANLLVPHLAQAYLIHRRVRENAALAEALDRLPTGVILLDARRQTVLANRSAQRIIGLHDGFVVDASGPRASRPSDNAVLQKLLERATRGAGDSAAGSVLTISRPSGRRAYPLMLAPLLKAPPGSTLGDAAAVLYISDLEGSLRHSEVLRSLYSLTEAETELVELLCAGHSLEEAAERRGVTMNTARSQLKQVFAKTNTSRQSELVRLVLAGVAPLGDS